MNEGQRLLLSVTASVAEVAGVAGVSKAAVSYWRTGSKLPSSEVRAKLQERYGIHPSAWDRRPGEERATAASAPVSEPRATLAGRVEESTLDIAIKRQRLYAEMVEDEDLSAADRLRAGALEAKMIDTRRHLERDARLLERDIVQRTSAWAQVRRRTIDSLRAFPDALRAWTEAMGELARESETAPVQGALDDEDEEG